MSYAHIDNQYGQLSEFRERLSIEVHIQTGDPFPIFQDRDDIQFGESWHQRIVTALTSEATFLIPILTPSFFKSAACREELELFLKREKDLGRNDLVLPVYFVASKVLDDPETRRSDRLATAVSGRQWADWRSLRFESFTSPEVGKALMQLAAQITLALERVRAARTQPTGKSRGKKRATSPGVTKRDELRRKPSVVVYYAAADEAIERQFEPYLSLLYSKELIDSWRIRNVSIDTETSVGGVVLGDIALFLVSPDFVASDFAYSSAVKNMVKRHTARDLAVIPVVVKPCDWGGTPFAKLPALPADAKPLSGWANREDAFRDVAAGIAAMSAQLRQT